MIKTRKYKKMVRQIKAYKKRILIKIEDVSTDIGEPYKKIMNKLML